MILNFNFPALLGYRQHIGCDAGGGREKVSRNCNKRFTGSVRAEKGQGQQGHNCFQYNVCCGPVSEIFESSLEVFENGC